MVFRKIDRSKYKEYIENARECTVNHVYPLSVVTGTQDGEIYTDDRGCILFWHYCGFAHISGNVIPEVLEAIYQKFFVPDIERRFLLITDSEVVSNYYLSRDLLRSDKRIEYSHCGIPDILPELDDRFVFERITSGNVGDIQGRIIPSFSWKNKDAFLQNGFGFITRSKQNGCFAAVAFSSAVSPEEVDIGVETAEAYRNHGLASYLAYRMCEETIQQGKKPVWAHAQTNAGSRKTALNVGLKPRGINTVIQRKQTDM